MSSRDLPFWFKFSIMVAGLGVFAFGAALLIVLWLPNTNERLSNLSSMATTIIAGITFIALLVTAAGAAFAARQLRLNRIIAKHQFLLQFFEMIQRYNDIHVRLRDADGAYWEPSSTEEWNRVKRYVGLLGSIKDLVSDSIFDLVSADENYSHRAVLLLKNKSIYEMIYNEEKEWPQFKALVKILKSQPQFESKIAVEPSAAPAHSPVTRPVP